MWIDFYFFFEIWIACDQKHVPGDAIFKHFFTLYSIITESQKYPAYIDLNPQIHIFLSTIMKIFIFNESSEDSRDIQDAFLDQNFDTFLVKGKMCQSETGKVSYIDILLGIHAVLQYEINSAQADDLVE